MMNKEVVISSILNFKELLTATKLLTVRGEKNENVKARGDDASWFVLSEKED